MLDEEFLNMRNFLNQREGSRDIATVAAVKSTYDNLRENLHAICCKGELFADLAPKKVVIKLNLCDARSPETGAITHPIFLDCLLEWLRRKYGNKTKITVVESDATVAAPDLFVQWYGFDEIIAKWDAEYVNLSKVPFTLVPVRGNFFRQIPVPRPIAESDMIITLAKLKTSALTKISGALKNQFGCLPYRRKIHFHHRLDDAIVDTNLAMRPDVCIVDGVIAHVGSKGPCFGQPYPGNLFLIGKDPVAVDSSICRILGFSPRFVSHIRKAAKRGIGTVTCELSLRGFAEMPRIPAMFNIFEYFAQKIANKALLPRSGWNS